MTLSAAATPALSAGLDPDRDEARRWLARELAQPDYNRLESVVERLASWLLERLGALVELVPGSPGLSTVLLALVLLLAGLAAWFAVRGARRAARLTAPGAGAVLEDRTLRAADYRARAAAAWRTGDWDALLLDSYRAIAAAADERTLLEEVPGRTAHEIALALGERFPQHREQLAVAADGFDGVRYGHLRAGEPQARAVADLESALARARPRLGVPG